MRAGMELDCKFNAVLINAYQKNAWSGFGECVRLKNETYTSPHLMFACKECE